MVLMLRFSEGKIYKICNYIQREAIYVGSTCGPSSKRYLEHQREAKSRKKTTRPLNLKMRAIGCEFFYMELVENYPCSSLQELRLREGFHISRLGTLNAVLAGRNPKIKTVPMDIMTSTITVSPIIHSERHFIIKRIEEIGSRACYKELFALVVEHDIVHTINDNGVFFDISLFPEQLIRSMDTILLKHELRKRDRELVLNSRIR